MKKNKDHSTGIIFILLILGIAIIFYPHLANLYNQKKTSKAITSYVEKTKELSPYICETANTKISEYNNTLRNYPHTDGKLDDGLKNSYESLLNINGDGIMGYISIPKIGIEAPIFHYTSNQVLNFGVGHVEYSSLPGGGVSTHTVLAAHSGLLGNYLFTDLNQLDIGDKFFLNILNETLVYEVVEIHCLNLYNFIN